MIEAMVFDYGNVLVRWHPERVFAPFFPDPVALARFMDQIDFPAWHLRHDQGVDFAANRRDLIERHPAFAEPLTAFDTRFAVTLGTEIAESAAIVDALAHAGFPLFLLTNMPQSKKAVCLAASARTHLFLDVVCSGEEGIAKPDPAIYALTEARIASALGRRIAPDAIGFVDDSPANVESARARGWQAVRFVEPARLADDLRAIGLALPSLPV
jgi:FMN phosphatase YigB (HAD superfamily)